MVLFESMGKAKHDLLYNNMAHQIEHLMMCADFMAECYRSGLDWIGWDWIGLD